ncbi:MAG: hypothetical protein GY909_15555 [Oligoflexia bacterium]|nr:hypothetical protein [Oligoflexia bacterium]
MSAFPLLFIDIHTTGVLEFSKESLSCPQILEIGFSLYIPNEGMREDLSFHRYIHHKEYKWSSKGAKKRNLYLKNEIERGVVDPTDLKSAINDLNSWIEKKALEFKKDKFIPAGRMTCAQDLPILFLHGLDKKHIYKEDFNITSMFYSESLNKIPNLAELSFIGYDEINRYSTIENIKLMMDIMDNYKNKREIFEGS